MSLPTNENRENEIPEAPPIPLPPLPGRRYPSARAPIFNIPISSELEQIIIDSNNPNQRERREGETN